MRVRANTFFTVLGVILNIFDEICQRHASCESGERVIWKVVKMILDGTFMNIHISVWHVDLDSG